VSNADTRLWEIIEQAARAVTDPDTGHFDQKAFVDELRARITADNVSPDVRAATLDETAKRLADSFVNRRKPKQRANGALFDPGAVLPLGDGKRVWMDTATAADLIAWAGLEAKNAARILAAAGRRQEYAADRLVSMRAHPGWLLGRVEREVYGWAEGDTPADYDEDDDDPEPTAEPAGGQR
jgi:hypothetical protein